MAREPLTRDVLINIPIARQHRSTGPTLSGKDLMGCADNRGKMHDVGRKYEV